MPKEWKSRTIRTAELQAGCSKRSGAVKIKDFCQFGIAEAAVGAGSFWIRRRCPNGDGMEPGYIGDSISKLNTEDKARQFQ
jgi:hypothetical protein